jgi:hypothetical protein
MLITVFFTWTGCGNPAGGGSETDDKGGFSVSGSFAKSEDAGGGVVNFALKSGAATGLAVTAESYTISGALEDGDLTIRLRGSYDPNTGNWSVSAKSSAIIYTLDGNVDRRGVSRGSTATIAVKNGEEWIPYIFPVMETAVSIPGTVTEEGESGGIPSFAQGIWYGTDGHESYVFFISDWKVTAVEIKPWCTKPDERSTTILDCNETGDGSGSYEVILCWPEYAQNSGTLLYVVQAMAECLGIPMSDIEMLDNAPYGRAPFR